MPDISFQPTFNDPEPWVDGRDKVKAGGTNGFNQRFNEIADDLATIGDVVGSINTSLIALGQRPPAVQRRLTLAPALFSLSADKSWGYDINGFATRARDPNPSGLVPVTLPVGVKLLKLRVIGSRGGTVAKLKVELRRCRLVGALTAAETLLTVDVNDAPFDQNPDIPGAPAVEEDFRYFLLATVSNATSLADEISLGGFQILYQEGG